MNINSLNGGKNIYQTDNKLKKKYSDESSTRTDEKSKVITDKLEISEEVFKLAPIKQKIAQGFYDNPDVLKDIAKKLMSDISPDSK